MRVPAACEQLRSAVAMCLRISLGDVDDGDKWGWTMDADQVRAKAYELALLTLSRIPQVFTVDQILQEAVKIERWLMSAPPQQQNASATAQTGAGTAVWTSPNSGWVTVGHSTVQPAPTPPPKPVKKADW